MPQVSESRDQRRFRRYSVSFPCTIKPKKTRRGLEQPALQTRTRDVSVGGLFFTVKRGLKVGTEIECTIRLLTKSSRNAPVAIHCRGKIVRIVRQDGSTIGVGATIDSFRFIDSPTFPMPS